MSEPKRYEAMGPEVIATPTGEFVLYEDYARLKAEVERLTAFCTTTIIPNDKLQARIEQLTRAVSSSPVAQARLKELEGKITFDEINPKEVRP